MAFEKWGAEITGFFNDAFNRWECLGSDFGRLRKKKNIFVGFWCLLSNVLKTFCLYGLRALTHKKICIVILNQGHVIRLPPEFAPKVTCK